MFSITKALITLGRYLLLMGRAFSRPERMRMFLKKYVKEMSQLGVDSIGIVLLISFFIGAVICIQMKLNIQSPWMPRWVSGYTTREIMLLEFSSSIMCLILAGKVGSNIASELGTMRVTQQILGKLSYPAQNRCAHNHHAVSRHLLVCYGYRRSLCHSLHRTCVAARRPYSRTAARLQLMVYVDVDNKERVLRLHHCQCLLVLRLHRRGWLGRCGQGFDKRSSKLERAHTLLRRIPHAVAQLT